jgi:hypothetical protein
MCQKRSLARQTDRDMLIGAVSITPAVQPVAGPRSRIHERFTESLV